MKRDHDNIILSTPCKHHNVEEPIVTMSEFDKVTFLKTCIEASDIHIDFQKVADELGIKRNAAYMRYQRMMKPGSTPSPQNLEFLQTCFRISGCKPSMLLFPLLSYHQNSSAASSYSAFHKTPLNYLHFLLIAQTSVDH